MATFPDPYYTDGQITIYHGDCRKIAPLLDFEGLVLTDPPYGIALKPNCGGQIGRPLGAGQRGTPRAEYAPVHGDDEPFDPRWLLDVGSARVIWGANHFAQHLPPSSGWLVWDKQRPDDLDQATCELAWTDHIKGVRRFVHMWNGMLRASEQGAGRLVHPTQKPVALMVWCMTLRWSPPQADILDPYMGSGSTLRAAMDCGRSAIGIELSEEYCEKAVERLRQTVLPL